MPKAETLRQVKRVEEEVSRLRTDAANERERILKEAREKATAIVAEADREGDTRYTSHLEQVSHEVETERQTILDQGRAEAESIRNAASGDDVGKAAALIVERFQKSVLES